MSSLAFFTPTNTQDDDWFINACQSHRQPQHAPLCQRWLKCQAQLSISPGLCESGFLQGVRKWMKTSELIVFCHRTPFKCSSPTFAIGMKVWRLTERPNWMPNRGREASVPVEFINARAMCCDLCFAFLLFFLFFFPYFFYGCCLSVPGLADCDSLLSNK